MVDKKIVHVVVPVFDSRDNKKHNPQKEGRFIITTSSVPRERNISVSPYKLNVSVFVGDDLIFQMSEEDLMSIGDIISASK